MRLSIRGVFEGSGFFFGDGLLFFMVGFIWFCRTTPSSATAEGCASHAWAKAAWGRSWWEAWLVTLGAVRRSAWLAVSVELLVAQHRQLDVPNDPARTVEKVAYGVPIAAEVNTRCANRIN